MENNSVQSPNAINQIQLPNSSGILVMGILSLVSFCCFAAGIVGLTLGILALVLGNKAIKIYNSDPKLYTEKSIKNVRAGRTCGIIGICLGGLAFIGLIIYLSIVGFAIGTILSTLPWNVIH